MNKHESYMRWAIALALEGQGQTSPNPLVGAVLIKGGKVVGEGYHRRAGAPHAEVNAIMAAGVSAKGADLYVTLEPCAHHGRTPPCVDAIIEAGIKKVIVGTRDPNPKVSGRGISKLKKAGIGVMQGVLNDNCKIINEAYNKYIVTGMPFVTAKVALSLDGKIATHTGDSKWITGEACRRYVHRLRSEADAVLVGGNTVRVDNPQLNVRLKNWRGREPLAVVIDETLNLPREAKLFSRGRGQVVVMTTAHASISKFKWIEKRGQTVIVCPADKNGFVSLRAALTELGNLGVSSVLIEGGGTIFSSAFKLGLVDKLVACISPKIIGGKGLDFLPQFGIKNLKSAMSLKCVSVKQMGEDVVVEGRLR